MTDIQPLDSLTKSFSDALPDLRRTQQKGWVIVALITVATLAALVLSLGFEQTFGVIVGLSVLSVFAIGATFAWVRKSHERALMPLLCTTFGLYHAKGSANNFNALPSNFIPLGSKRSQDDVLSGAIGDRRFHFAEAKTETGGKNSRTLFRGLLIEVQCVEPMPPFLIAPVSKTKGFWLFKGTFVVDGMERTHSAYGQDQTEYGLWSRSPEPAQRPGLQAFLDRMVQLGPLVLGESSLYSVVSTGREIHVALTHARNLFSIGGLTASEAEILSQIRSAASEIDHPLRLVAEILRAEAALRAA